MNTEVLFHGSHKTREDGMCAMEMVAYLANEPHSDRPECACPVITSFVIGLNDQWNDDDRQLLKPYLPRILNTRDGNAIKRAEMLAMAACTRITSHAIELIGLKNEADKMRSATTLVDAKYAAESAAESAAKYAAESAAKYAAKYAAESAAKYAAEYAAESAAKYAAESAAESAAKYAAEYAAESAAKYAAESAKYAAESAAESAAKYAAESAAESAEKCQQDIKQECLAVLEAIIAIGESERNEK